MHKFVMFWLIVIKVMIWKLQIYHIDSEIYIVFKKESHFRIAQFLS